MKKTPALSLETLHIDAIYQSVAALIHQARANVLKSVNHEQVIAYWHIGKKIVEQEQAGENRAEYSVKLLEVLSEKLTREFGRGFSAVTLRAVRQFYITYKDRIRSEPRSKSPNELEFDPNLSWTHYKILMRETRPEVRHFYEIEQLQAEIKREYQEIQLSLEQKRPS